jgi:hypothetical protein
MKRLRILHWLPLWGCLLRLAGCRGDVLKTASKLTPDFSTNEVYALFSDYEVMSIKTGGVAHISRDAVMFRSHVPVALRITFAPRRRWFHTFESCKIYFDADGKALGYYYERPD